MPQNQMLRQAQQPWLQKAAEAPKGILRQAQQPQHQLRPQQKYATNAPSPAARKILDEKNIQPSDIVGTGKGGRVTKEDAINAVPAMGTPTGGSRGSERTKLSMLRRKSSRAFGSGEKRNRDVNHVQRS